MRSLLLFTRDLRIHDHPALAHASRGEVLPLFVLEPQLLAISPTRTRFLIESLRDLDDRLSKLGTPLVVRWGDASAVAPELARRLGCDSVLVTADGSTFSVRRERALRERCATDGIEVRTFPGHAVVEPGAVAPKSPTSQMARDTPVMGAYRVFTPYLRAWSAASRRPMLDTPRRLRPVPESPSRAGALPLPGSVKGAAPWAARGGETRGRARLAMFLREGLRSYEGVRNRLDLRATSRLSPYLRFGCVSPLEVAERAASAGDDGRSFVRQLAWRDFFLQLLAADPALSRIDLRPRTAGRPVVDAAALDEWRGGRTGQPVVDAAMLQLLNEGWIPNRARLVVASYLTRTLGMDWRPGAAHFARHLLDGDPASNAGNWQWVAGTGANPRPGIALNISRQAARFDPDGRYAATVLRRVPGEPS